MAHVTYRALCSSSGFLYICLGAGGPSGAAAVCRHKAEHPCGGQQVHLLRHTSSVRLSINCLHVSQVHTRPSCLRKRLHSSSPMLAVRGDTQEHTNPEETTGRTGASVCNLHMGDDAMGPQVSSGECSGQARGAAIFPSVGQQVLDSQSFLCSEPAWLRHKE